MRRAVATGTLVLIFMVPTWALAQQRADCSSVYEGHEAEVGSQVQLEDGSYITVKDPDVCMGESLEHASSSAISENQSSSSSSSSSAATSSSSSGSSVAGAQTVNPQGGVGTGLGGLSDPNGIPMLVLLGGLVAALVGAVIARRRSA